MAEVIKIRPVLLPRDIEVIFNKNHEFLY